MSEFSQFTTTVHDLKIGQFDFGLNDYPIFDEQYRASLNAKILEHFEMYEIGQKQPGLFKFYLNRAMREIMPYYNQLYKSSLLDFNPFHTFDLTTTSTRTSNGTNETENHSDNTRTPNTNNKQTTKIKDVSSNTPDALLSIGDIENNVYATIANIQSNEINDALTGTDTTEVNENNINTLNNVDEYISHVVGTDSARTNASILMELRTSFINIDMMICDDPAIKELFLGVW